MNRLQPGPSSALDLSVVMPARNEEGCIADTIKALHRHLSDALIAHEIIVVNDGSQDGTRPVLDRLRKEVPALVVLDNAGPNGFGVAVRLGLAHFRGKAVAIYMADGSDTPVDLVSFFRTWREKGVDCVFGTRFSKKSKVVDYPMPKLILNRILNNLIRVLFNIRYNDTTNAFKLYSADTIRGLQPLLSPHFNLTVELPLKAIVRGYSYAVVPNDWLNRKHGISKLKVKEMGSRYLFIIIYCFIEKWLVSKDYQIDQKKHET